MVESLAAPAEDLGSVPATTWRLTNSKGPASHGLYRQRHAHGTHVPEFIQANIHAHFTNLKKAGFFKSAYDNKAHAVKKCQSDVSKTGFILGKLCVALGKQQRV